MKKTIVKTPRILNKKSIGLRTKTIQQLIIGISVVLVLIACENGSKKEAIRMSIERQMSIYPRSTLVDLYKHFFQDCFGPGHLIADTAAAGRYLQSELSLSDTLMGVVYEPTGYQGHFYRVNLSVIKEGIVPYDIYFDAFVRSVNGIEPMPVEKWIKEWQLIESVIADMNLRLPHYEQQKQEIAGVLQAGKYVMHHSREFGETYDPHYRIIEKTIFEKEILPFIIKRDSLNSMPKGIGMGGINVNF